MGRLRHRDDVPHGRRFRMPEKLVSIGEDAWIEDHQGERVYKVDGKALRPRATYLPQDRRGNEVAEVQVNKLSVREKMKVERDGQTLATVHKALVGIRARFDIDVEDGADLKARGNVLQHEDDIKRGDAVVASISKERFRVRDAYGGEIAAGEDEPLLLVPTVPLDRMSRHRRDQPHGRVDGRRDGEAFDDR
jgi:uncharacterized protein YxjI